MRIVSLTCVGLALAAVLGFDTGANADVLTYTPVTNLGGLNVTRLNGISGNTLIGDSDSVEDIGGNTLVHTLFSYNGSNLTILGIPPGPVEYGLWASDVSGNTVVGTFFGNGAYHGYVFDNSSYKILDVPATIGDGTYATGIYGNTVVGYTGGGQGYIYNGSTFTSLNVPSALATYPLAIYGNTVVGYYYGSNYLTSHGFIYDGTNFTTIDDPFATAGFDGTELTGVYGNAVVGTYQYSLNDFHSFIYHDGTFTDLTIPSTASSPSVTGIYGNEMVGSYQDSSGNGHGFIAIDSSLPSAVVPEPSMFGGAMLMGLAGVMRWRRH